MKIKEIKVKSIIVKTNLPEGDFVINPYVGCSHACVYCYARFMKRFTNHPELWGEFVDVKINAPDLIPENIDKYKGKFITIGSVTDPYQPFESKYKLTRQILKKLIPLRPKLDVITKSDLVLRDIDLLKQFNDCVIAVSASFWDKKVKDKLEPKSITTEKRLKALKQLNQAEVRTALFISPIFPEVSDWRKLIDASKEFVNEYWFENLNLYPSIKDKIYNFLRNYDVNLVDHYQQIYSERSGYWQDVENDIRNYCNANKLTCRIYFHHKTAH